MFSEFCVLKTAVLMTVDSYFRGGYHFGIWLTFQLSTVKDKNLFAY